MRRVSTPYPWSKVLAILSVVCAPSSVCAAGAWRDIAGASQPTTRSSSFGQGGAGTSRAVGRVQRQSYGPERILSVLNDIDSSLVESHYSHVTRVQPKLGTYDFDCSGMVDWVLRRAAPAAWQSVRARSATGRLVASDFVRAIAAIAPERSSWGWQRVARVADAQPGDVIAWLKPKGWQSAITGHVGFVLEAPASSRRVSGGILIRFADASRYTHDHDTRARSGRDGFGYGTILITTHPDSGAPVAYGWFGDQSAWVAETEIVIGRPRR